MLQHRWALILGAALFAVLPVMADVETGLRVLTPTPQGEKIFFIHVEQGFPETLYAMNPDGGGKTPVLEGSILEFNVTRGGEKKILVSAGDTSEHYGDEQHRWGPVHMHLWLYDEKDLRQLTSGALRDMAASWAWDKKSIYFSRASNVKMAGNEIKSEPIAIYMAAPDGKNARSLTLSATYDNVHPRPTPDRRYFTFTSNRNKKWQIYMADSDGKNERVFIEDGFMGDWSPSGEYFAFLKTLPGDIFLANREGKIIKQLTTSGRVVSEPAWSPDGKKLAYAQLNGNIPSQPPEAKEPKKDATPELLSKDGHGETPPPVMVSYDPGKEEPLEDIWVLHLDGKTPPKRLTHEGVGNRSPRWTK